MNIYTIVYNNTSFLELQYLSFKKHCQLETFTVIDNSDNVKSRTETLLFAASHDCNVIYTEQPRWDSAGFSHQQALETALKHAEGRSLICDPDVFLLGPLTDKVNDCDFAGLMQGTEKVRYLWPGFLVINTATLKEPLDIRGAIINPDNFDDFIIPDTAAGWSWADYPEQLKTRITTDSGGLLCRYLKKYSPKIVEFSLDFCTEMCDTTKVIPEHLISRYVDAYHFWVIGGNVLHSARLSNWDSRPNDEVIAKSALVKDIVEYYLNVGN